MTAPRTHETNDIEIPLRADYYHELEFTDSASVPFDVSTWTFTSKLRRLDGRREVLATFGVNADSSSTGKIVLYLSSASTSALADEAVVGWDVRYEVNGHQDYLWPESKAKVLVTQTYDDD